MDSALHIYEATNSYLNQTTSWSLGILLFSLLAIWYNQKRKIQASQRNIQKVISLLLGFAVLLASGSAFFSWLTSNRIGPVEVFSDRIITNEATIPAKQIKKAYMFQSTPNSIFQLNALGDSSLLFIIEEFSGKTHVFAEDNYPIQQMMDDLRPWLRNATDD